MFLAESSLIGIIGIIGIGLSYLISSLNTYIGAAIGAAWWRGNGAKAADSTVAGFLAVAFSMAIGLTSGLYPPTEPFASIRLQPCGMVNYLFLAAGKVMIIILTAGGKKMTQPIRIGIVITVI